jgi:hypothetical protein
MGNLFVYLAACIFLLGSCCQQKGWIYREVISDFPQFDSAQLMHVPENKFNGIEVELLTGEFGTLGFLNVYCGQIPSGTLILQIGGCNYPYTGIVMEGGQRLLLPDAAIQTIIQSLLSGQTIRVCLEGFWTELCPENFSRRYCRFSRK